MSESVEAALARVDERLSNIEGALGLPDGDSHFVSRDEFVPVRLLVYGATAIILLAVVGGLVAMVLRSPEAHAEPSTPGLLAP